MSANKNFLEYKGYMGKVNYSQEDEVLYGVIFGIDDLVTYEGTDVHEIKIAFEEAVDDYLAMCHEIGKEPDKMYKGQFNVRIEPEVHKKLANMAFRSGKSLNQVMEDAAKCYISVLNEKSLTSEQVEQRVHSKLKIGQEKDMFKDTVRQWTNSWFSQMATDLHQPRGRYNEFKRAFIR